VRDVLIAGAGYAGISAAYELRHLDVEVLEANSEVGGRASYTALEHGAWVNWGGAFYGPDRVRCAELVHDSGVSVISATPPLESDMVAFVEMGNVWSESDQRALDEIGARFATEQSHEREPTSPELDGRTLADWLGPLPSTVAAFMDHWAQIYLGGDATDVSLYGAIVAWGPFKTVAFTAPDDVPVHGLGTFVVSGGSARVLDGLIERHHLAVTTNVAVEWATEEDGGVTVTVRSPGGERRRLRARQFICALPAQVALHILDVPDWKREVVNSSGYARRVVMPIQILPPGEPRSDVHETVTRPHQIYESYGHTHRVPEPREQLEASGGCVNGEVYDRISRRLWDDPDHTIVTGATRRLAFRFPEFVGRMRPAGVRRWRYGIPTFYPGRINNFNATTASVGRIHFCGDYCVDIPASMEAASRSGVRAARDLLAAI
jgi:protoporphyrinogen/coproporphyrinogen III oxidase